MYVDRAGLGRVIWPIILCVYAENFWELVEEVKKRNLWLFDFWAYVPFRRCGTSGVISKRRRA